MESRVPLANGPASRLSGERESNSKAARPIASISDRTSDATTCGASWSFSAIRLFPEGGTSLPAPWPIQRKLEIGAIDDPLEREADAVADRVLRMPDPEKCSACQNEEEETHEKLARKAVTGTSASAESPAPSIVYHALSETGWPLDIGTRAFFEPRFGFDFSNVCIHAGARAAESAGSVDALAYTVGHHVVFGANQFAPATSAGSRLLAHELAHVVQQTHGAPRTISRRPTKSGIKKSDYSYSNNCGWIDWGHANPGLAKKLIASVQQASDDLKAAGTGTPSSSPTMAAKKFGVVFSSASMEVTLARPLTPDEVLAVSLSMFKNLSMIFEIQQEWTDWFSGSSFSQEDLPSNLISFYRAAKAFSTDQIKQYCDSQDVETSLKEYEKNSDFQKNRTFSPIGASGSWPAELSTIDETKGASLYKVTGVSVGGPASGFTFCPLYRVVGTIDDTDLFILSVGGATFADADNVRVVPTYRVDTDRVSGSGHVPYVEVKPYGQSDADKFDAKKVKTPLYVPSSVLVCVGDIEGGDMAGHLMRKPESPESEAPAAPPIVSDVLNASGEPLDRQTRAFMEPRFGHDFSRVRIHTDATAAESARSVNARAYTVGNDIVFARGTYAPASREGQGLLAHELGHVVQQAGNFLRRDDPKPPANRWDRIANEVFSYDTYEEYLSKDLKSTTFFGQSLSGLNDEMVQTLQKVETNLKAKQGEPYTAPAVGSTLRKRAGMHGWGMAIDFDVLRNPYVLHETGESELDKELLPAYDHIAQFMLGDSQSSLRKLKLGRKAFGSGSVGEVYDALRRESDAMKKYFAMKDDDSAIANYVANDWPASHQGQTLPDVVAIKAQMKEDYEVLGGKTDTGAKRPTRGKADRPFAPVSGGGQGDPATGFLNLGKEFVEAMTDAGLAWGAIDIAGEPGDIQHFDLRLSGTGAKVYNLTWKYK
jgi:Domain of unknown function (DUF4157)